MGNISESSVFVDLVENLFLTRILCYYTLLLDLQWNLAVLKKRKSPEVVRGYEIHMGKTKLNSAKSLFKIKRRSGKKCLVYDGAVSRDGKVWGTYMHGVFDNDGFRRRFLCRIGKKKKLPVNETAGNFEYEKFKEAHYDKLADLVRNSLDMKLIYKLVGI